MRDGVEVISRRMVQRAESPLLFSAVLISAAVRSAQAGRETSTLPWIWKLALISDLGTPENLPCSPVSHPRSPPSITRCCSRAVGQKSLPAPAVPLPDVPGHPGTPLQGPQRHSCRQEWHLPLPGPFVPPRPQSSFGKPSSVRDASSSQPSKPQVSQLTCSSTTSAQPPSCCFCLMSLSQLEDSGCATFVYSRCYQSLQPAHPGGSWKAAGF